MPEGNNQYHYAVTYERQDALDASSFFADMNEQGRGGWRLALAGVGIGLLAMGMFILSIPPEKIHSEKSGPFQIFIVAAIALGWSVDPAFRDFTRRLWLRRGEALTADFSDAGVTIERNLYGSRFTAWSDVASVTERADGILLVFNDNATPVPGKNALYRHLGWMIGSPIFWLPTRAFVNYEAKWELRDFAHQFVPQSTDGDESFFRRHVATFLVMILGVIAGFAAPSSSQIEEAKYRKGLRYLDGDGVIRDDARGVALISTGARFGFGPAQNELGMLYAKGTHGVSKTPYQAEYWFKIAAASGLAEAQNNLGVYYEEFRAVPWTGPAAASWYLKAATQEYAPAQHNLCRIYFYGFRVPRDEKQAAYWCQKEAEAGFGQAEYILGTLYMTGAGVPKDNTLAENWFRKSADQGFPQAKINLSLLTQQ
jgi:hypothetical protein